MAVPYPCVVDGCPNAAHDHRWVCHGSLDQRCYVNWGSTDPEDTEPYETYLDELKASK